MSVENEPVQTPPTPEQIKAYEEAKLKRKAYQEEQMPILETDAKYLGLLADIDESILRREMARAKLANLLAPPEKTEEKK
jgi:hypothetical protein